MNKLYDILDVAKYIAFSSLSKQISVSPLKIQKMLYYAQAWSMVFGGRKNQLFEDIPEAWVNGPVYPRIYDIWKERNMCEHLKCQDFGTTETSIMDDFEKQTQHMKLTKNEQSLLEQIVVLYGTKSQNQLIFLTHSELPWVEMRKGLEPFERSNRKISLDTMYKYYSDRHQRNLAAHHA